ncbi:hypothetical protein H4S07_001065 [Coemansia furcata]|uniref:Uncharacterized protein n=1 Tax=Coemansia furcata TaxID=417177 RepID=A0ACC1LQJ0_9FUNG|nr:hypothetical protein H4S07_001065 [Coemansia furcata]
MESSFAVSRATRILHYYATTQIDELLSISSSELTQRWDFLGPQARNFASPEFFSEVDAALQWRKSDVGDFIRHSHFALELTEEQAETLCDTNVLFDVVGDKVHALAPFASTDTEEEGSLIYAVDLVMDVGEWWYFDMVACKGKPHAFQSPRNSELYASYEEAYSSISSNPSKGKEDDDDYWGQYSEEEEEQNQEEEEEQEIVAAIEPTSTNLIAEAGKHALKSAAAAMQAMGVTEEQFVTLARKAFREYNSVDKV